MQSDNSELRAVVSSAKQPAAEPPEGRYQSGETDVSGHITRVGDAAVRTALHDAANVLLPRMTKFSALKPWAMDVAKPWDIRGQRSGYRAPPDLADGTEFV